MLLFVAAAHAADAPGLWFSEALGLSAWPSGVLSTTSAEVRVPLYRSDFIVFHDTQAGVGLVGLSSPAFVLGGPRVTLAPIDVFDVTLKAAWGGYFDNGLGLVNFDAPRHTLEWERALRPEDSVGATAWMLSAEPTLKARVWKIVLFDAWTISHFRIDRPAGDDHPMVYEPLTDMVIGWNDTVIEQQAVVAYEGADGEQKPLLLAGPTFKNRWTVEAGDRSVLLGAIVVARPGVRTWVPTLVAQALWYLDDPDREGPIPLIQAQASWEVDLPFR